MMPDQQQMFANPQEIFQQFAKQHDELWKSFAADQSQEMVKKFSEAWTNWANDSVEHPQKWFELMTQYQQEQMNLWMKMLEVGKSEPVVKPQPGDRRFSAKEWEENPVFDYLKQSYLMFSKVLTDMADNMHLDEENKKRLKFYTRYFIDAISPTNFAATNPEVIRQAIESKGKTLLDGLSNMLTDMEKGRITMTDENAFQIGKNLAVTPGAVVYENDIMQVIQYKPSTETVADRPLVIVPPCINKFYILDLQPQNSFVKYAVDQGNTVFLISWVNPSNEHRDYAWEDYVSHGVIEALGVIKAITGAAQLNTVSWCVGGTLLASALAVMEGKKDKSVASATFFTTMLDFSDPGELGVFIDEVQVARREQQIQGSGLLSGKDLALAFSMIRANDLIWSYVVNNYLKGQTPSPFDILYWNSDPTNLPAKMYTDYIRNMYLENKLVEPNALTFCGVPIDLRKIKVPSYFLSTIDDHIAPWKTTYTSTELFSGPIEFVLGASGHIAGVINSPVKNKRSYWTGGKLGKGADTWLETAESQPGSWWPHWDQWLKNQGNQQIAAPTALGNAQYRVVEPAPGRYVTQRIA